MLCKACYGRFRERGTLERSDKRNKPLAASARRCTYVDCERPEESRHYQISEGTTAGGQDWSSLAGSVLCNACYTRFYRNGTLERSDRNKPLMGKRKGMPQSDLPVVKVRYIDE